MTATRTRSPLVIGSAVVGLVVAVVVAVALLAGGSSAPTSVAAPPSTLPTGPLLRWEGGNAIAHGSARALHVDSRGRALVLMRSGPWVLMREDGHGAARTVLRQFPRSAGADIDSADGDFGVDARGRPIVVWTSPSALLADVDGRKSVVARGKHIVVANSVIPLYGARDPIAVSPDGSAVVAWRTLDDSGESLWIAQRRPGARVFGAPRRLGDIREDPFVLADGRGGATVVWLSTAGVRAVERRPGGSFGSPQLVAADDEAQQLGAGIGRDGRVIVVYSDDHGVRALERPAGQRAFSHPVTLLSQHFGGHAPGIAIGDRGPASIVWGEDVEHHGASSGILASVTWPAGHGPSAPRRLTVFDVDTLEGGRVVLPSPAGNVVVFSPSTRFNDQTYMALTPGGQITSLLTLPPAAYPLFASGPGGVVAVYSRGDEFVARLSRLSAR